MASSKSLEKEKKAWDFPGCPVVNTPCFQCRAGWFGELRPHMPRREAKRLTTTEKLDVLKTLRLLVF